MSSKQKINTCHRCLTAKCMGVLKDPRSAYGRHAFWCKHLSGWHAAPCKHLQKKRK